MLHSWFNIDEHNSHIYINMPHADINDEIAHVVVLTVMNYTGNALADEMENAVGC